METNEQQLWNARSFPEGARNCYTLTPKRGKGARYLIRARFLYGNYDSAGNLPTFDLHLGVDLWDTVIISSVSDIINKEIIHVSSSDQIHVCLVNTGLGTPFISVLELRPLAKDIYETETAGSLQLRLRYDLGASTDKIMRYKDDIYDRLWRPFESDLWTPLNVSDGEKAISDNGYGLPFTVMSTAFTRNVSTGRMGVSMTELNPNSTYFFYFHFAELVKLQKNESRAFNMYKNGILWYKKGPIIPEYLNTLSIYSTGGTTPDIEGDIVVWFNVTANSTLPPLINAMEVYVLLVNSGQETYQADVNAIQNIKSEYGLKISNWQGDPCSPQDYSWDGLNCTYDYNDPPRITSLNLSSKGLRGEISSYFADLSKLQYLDLSNNSLSGTVPEFLAKLSSLKTINIQGNNLDGPLPVELRDRMDAGLSLRADDNLIAKNETTSSSGYFREKNKFDVSLLLVVSALLLLFVP